MISIKELKPSESHTPNGILIRARQPHMLHTFPESLPGAAPVLWSWDRATSTAHGTWDMSTEPRTWAGDGIEKLWYTCLFNCSCTKFSFRGSGESHGRRELGNREQADLTWRADPPKILRWEMAFFNPGCMGNF